MQLSRKVDAMQHSPIRKFYKYANEAKLRGLNVFHLNIGQPDIRTPKAFREAIRGYDTEVLSYAPSEGIPELIMGIQEYYSRYGMRFEKNDIIVTDGGSEALYFVLTSILNPGDEIIMPEPYYTNYTTFIGMADGRIVTIPTVPDDGYHYADREKIEAVISPNTKAILLSSPNNPTGNVLTFDEMRMICDLAKEHDFFIITDEAYREFVYDGRTMGSFGMFPDVADRVIIVDSISKRFSACGARIGCVITKNAELHDNIMKLAQGRLSAPTLDQLGAVALYAMDPSYFDSIKAEYQLRRDMTYDALMKIPGVVCVKPAGAFYITAKLPIDDAEKFLIFLLTEFDDHGDTVMFAPAEGFYGTAGMGKSEVRIAYVLNVEDMVRAIEVLKHGIEAYNSKRR